MKTRGWKEERNKYRLSMYNSMKVVKIVPDKERSE